MMAGTVRRDTPASSAGTTGDNATLNTDALGHTWVALPAIVRISQTPTVSTSPAYTAKDAVGGLLTFANAVRTSGGNAVLQSVIVIDNSQQRPSLELVLFDRTFTASTDNAIFAPSDGDLANTVGVVAVNSWSDFSTNSVATVDGIGKALVLNGTSLFGQLVTRGTPTFVATSDIVVIVTILQN